VSSRKRHPLAAPLPAYASRVAPTTGLRRRVASLSVTACECAAGQPGLGARTRARRAHGASSAAPATHHAVGRGGSLPRGPRHTSPERTALLLLAAERAALRQARLAARRLAQHHRARRAHDDVRGVREHRRDLQAARAAHVHEVAVGGLHARGWSGRARARGGDEGSPGSVRRARCNGWRLRVGTGVQPRAATTSRRRVLRQRTAARASARRRGGVREAADAPAPSASSCGGASPP
jgi:hypothetical protein